MEQLSSRVWEALSEPFRRIKNKRKGCLLTFFSLTFCAFIIINGADGYLFILNNDYMSTWLAAQFLWNNNKHGRKESLH